LEFVHRNVEGHYGHYEEHDIQKHPMIASLSLSREGTDQRKKIRRTIQRTIGRVPADIPGYNLHHNTQSH
jgi:hypothetical protein